MPIKSLRNWFDPDIVGRKRYEIQQLLLRLMEEQNIDVSSLKLPSLNLSVHSGDDSNDEYDYDEEDYFDDEDDFEDDDIEDADDDGEGDLNHPFDYQGLEGIGGDVGGGCHEGRSFRGPSLKRMYTLQDQHHRQHTQQRRLRSHQQSASEAEYMNEVVADDEDDLEGYDDDGSRDFELYGAEFDVENEDSHEEDMDANEAIGDADLYQDLDDIDEPKTCQRADSSGIPSRSRGTGRVPPADRGRRLVPPPGKATRHAQNPQLVSYDDDDDDEEDVEGVDEGICGGLVNEDDDDVEDLQHVDDDEDEVVHGLGEVIEEDETADAESERQLALANERLCGLNPESVTVSLMPRHTTTAAKNANSPGINPTAAPGTPSTAGERSQSLDALKAARPFGDIESADSPCSVSKKFRSN